jgi:hypothetical protein
MTAQTGPWSGEIYSQGMMMSDGQIYSQGMELSFSEGDPSGPSYNDPPNGGWNIGSPSSTSDTENPGDPAPVTDAFTNLAFDTPGGGSPGGGSPGGGSPGGGSPGGGSPGGGSPVSFDGNINGGNDGPPSGYGNPGNDGKPGGDDFGPHNPPTDHYSVPEPTSLSIFGTAILGWALFWAVSPRRKKTVQASLPNPLAAAVLKAATPISPIAARKLAIVELLPLGDSGLIN